MSKVNVPFSCLIHVEDSPHQRKIRTQKFVFGLLLSPPIPEIPQERLKKVFQGLARSVKKVPKKSPNTDFATFWLVSGCLGLFRHFFDTLP